MHVTLMLFLIFEYKLKNPIKEEINKKFYEEIIPYFPLA
jgi:hypothetical protein